MFLKRVKVSDFRVLKDVDLTFEPEFTPNIYPLGSLNGGGKSTLLQLIFTLLHCSFDESRHQYLVNLLSSSVKNKPDYFSLAEFEILHDNQESSLEFIVVKNDYESLDFDCFFNAEKQHEKIREKSILDPKYSSLLSFESKLRVLNVITPEIENELDKLIHEIKLSGFIYQSDFITYENIKKEQPENLLNKYRQIINNISTVYYQFFGKKQIDIAKKEKLKATYYLKQQNLLYITHVTKKTVLLCKTIAPLDFLKYMGTKVYLTTPSTQILLFLSSIAKKTLFSPQNNKYYSYVNNAKKILNRFFTYDFVPIDTIITAFTKARDKDFAEALKSDVYGNNLKNLKKGLDDFLLGKSIIVNKELNQVIFKLQDTGEELFPEDLSHGELKKLGIYILLKYHDIKDALILMDEIEIGFHPDWQYEIVNELQEWSNNNQFILATHSYALCEALTPSHVKELGPKLIKEK